MIIANPIYDVVFKYMMEDNKVAKKFISVIIGEEVIELDFAVREVTTVGAKKQSPKNKEVIELDFAAREITTVGAKKQSQKNKEKNKEKGDAVVVKLLRLDFVAKILTNKGYKTVTIEMQKASYPTDIMRFRQYIGTQYGSVENSYKDEFGNEHPREIYCIFFLGDGLDIKGVPVLVVSNVVHDLATGERLDVQNEFISKIHHKSWIIQVPCIPKRRRNELEKLLGIFDQNKIFDNKHLLNIEDEDFPEEFRLILRRLASALQNSNIKANMEFEDDILRSIRLAEQVKDNIIREKDKTIEEKDKAFTQEHAEKEKAIAKADEERTEKEKAIAKAEEERTEKEKERTEKEKERTEKEKALAKVAELERLLAKQ
jgi:hypothetical protein